jgi:acyl-CoA synthetase (NDP forming)/GNAT superfamily N-acetyltransferase
MAVDSPDDQDGPQAGPILLRDGRSARIRPLRPGDGGLLERFLRHQAPERLNRRFMGAAAVDREVSDLLAAGQASAPGRALSLAIVAGPAESEQMLALGSYTALGGPDSEAEVAFLVDGDWEGRGLATLLLERLAAAAYRHGVTVFRAETLAANLAMREVLDHSGFTVAHASGTGGDGRTVRLVIVPTEASLALFAAREEAAAVASMRRFFEPERIAVVGASRNRRHLGRRLFDHLLEAGFEGLIYPVNPHATRIGPIPAVAAVDQLPDGVDLALIALRPESVPAVLEALGRRHVRAVVAAGDGAAELGPPGPAALGPLGDVARREGFRLMGPGGAAVINTAPGVRLNASLAPDLPPAGPVALAVQTGPLGLSLLQFTESHGLGVSLFANLGLGADVSATDLLQYWGRDGNTAVIALQMESFGQAGRFFAVARRVGRLKPIVLLKPPLPVSDHETVPRGVLPAGLDAARSGLAAQTGVIWVDTVEDLVDAASLLARQPVPGGLRVAVITNADGPGGIARETLQAADLEVPPPPPALRAALARGLPKDALLDNPFDLGEAATAAQYGHTLRAILAADAYDSVLTLFIPRVLADSPAVLEALRIEARAARRQGCAKTLAACVIDQSLRTVLADRDVNIPIYFWPEAAARALSAATHYGRWRRLEPGRASQPEGIDESQVRTLLEAGPIDADGWLDVLTAFDVLHALGVPVIKPVAAKTPEEAGAAADALGGRVTLSLRTDGSPTGAPRVNLAGADAVTRAARMLPERLSARRTSPHAGGFLVQAALEAGIACAAGLAPEADLGRLIWCGLRRRAEAGLQHQVFRGLPLTDRDAAAMLDEVGDRWATSHVHAPVDWEAMQDVLLRLAWLAGRHPSIRQLELDPVMILPNGRGVQIGGVGIRQAGDVRP